MPKAKPKPKPPEVFPLPEGPAIERFRQRVSVSLNSLLPGSSTLADIVVAGYLVEAVHNTFRERLFVLNEALAEVRAQAAEMGGPIPLTPTVVGMVRRKADYLQQQIGDIVGEVSRVYSAMEPVIGVLVDEGEDGEVVEPDAPIETPQKDDTE